MTDRRELSVSIEKWPLVQPFVISRGAQHSVTVVVARLKQGAMSGWGESTPYARYAETPEGVAKDIEAHRPRIESDETITAKQLGLRGAAANALDCALVDFACKRKATRAWQLLNEAESKPLLTTATVTIASPQKMAADALKWPGFKLLKVKLGEKQGDVERIEAIRKARPDARLICDANEGWSAEQLKTYAGPLSRLGVEMIEQPLPSAMDEALRGLNLPVKICADESCHVAADVEKLVGKYNLVNVKLDKAGGITGALELIAAAKHHGMEIMVGCMLGTSLAMAPGLLAGQHATYVDLDGPLALSRDRVPPMSFIAGMVSPAPPELWG